MPCEPSSWVNFLRSVGGQDQGGALQPPLRGFEDAGRGAEREQGARGAAAVRHGPLSGLLCTRAVVTRRAAPTLLHGGERSESLSASRTQYTHNHTPLTIRCRARRRWHAYARCLSLLASLPLSPSCSFLLLVSRVRVEETRRIGKCAFGCRSSAMRRSLITSLFPLQRSDALRPGNVGCYLVLG